jgi:hypothetical protein
MARATLGTALTWLSSNILAWIGVVKLLVKQEPPPCETNLVM